MRIRDITTVAALAGFALAAASAAHAGACVKKGAVGEAAPSKMPCCRSTRLCCRPWIGVRGAPGWHPVTKSAPPPSCPATRTALAATAAIRRLMGLDLPRQRDDLQDRLMHARQ